MELRQWTHKDKSSLMNLCNEVDRTYLSGRMPFPYLEEDADWWLTTVEEHDGKDRIVRAIIVDGKVAGSISVEQMADVRSKDAEIGYMLDTDYWGQGVMTDAVREICEIAFREMDIIRITGMVYEPNVASAKVLEKNGFVLEGVLKNAVVKDENIYNLRIYGKVKP